MRLRTHPLLHGGRTDIRRFYGDLGGLPIRAAQGTGIAALATSVGEAILETIDAAVFIKRAAGQLIVVNDSGLRYLRRPAADVLGKQDSELLGPDELAVHQHAERRAVQTGRSAAYFISSSVPQRASIALVAPLQWPTETGFIRFVASIPSTLDREADPAAERVLMTLSRREREVLQLVGSGADNLKIAAMLGISERTVKCHVSNLYRKLGQENRIQLALLSLHFGGPTA
jgi:DNA-binding CsgD family transcriptional regulator